MQELINKLISEVGLSSEQAQQTINTIVTYVKSKVPAAMAGNIDAMFSGVKAEVKEETYREKAQEFAEATKDKLEDLAEDTKEKLEDFAEQAKEKLSEAADKAEDIAKDAFDKIKGMFNKGDNKA